MNFPRPYRLFPLLPLSKFFSFFLGTSSFGLHVRTASDVSLDACAGRDVTCDPAAPADARGHSDREAARPLLWYIGAGSRLSAQRQGSKASDRLSHGTVGRECKFRLSVFVIVITRVSAGLLEFHLNCFLTFSFCIFFYCVLKYAQTKVYQNRLIGTCLNLYLVF